MNEDYYKLLVQLEARMSRMEAIMQSLLLRLDIDLAEIMLPEPVEMRDSYDPIYAALLEGNKIQAIKLYRELSGVGLKEAKDAIDAMLGNLRR